MIEINDYILNPIRLNKKKKLDWYDLWIYKSDYISNYYNYIRGKYKIVDESFNYYIVLLEYGIWLLKDYSNYYDYVYVQHDIIINGMSYVKEDIKERDFAEYLKYLFYNNYDFKCICELIKKNSNKFNYYLVGVRLLFPSYYLFYFERFILDGANYNELYVVINRTSDYEEYLKKIINLFNKYLIKKIVLPF